MAHPQKIHSSLLLCITKTLQEKWISQILPRPVLQAMQVSEHDTFSAKKVELLMSERLLLS
jgi:hypothetical protein